MGYLSHRCCGSVLPWVGTYTVHQAEQLAVQPSYRAEVVMQHQMLVDAYTVHIQGRIDGLYEDDEGLIVEEIKSLLVPEEQFPAIGLMITRSTNVSWRCTFICSGSNTTGLSAVTSCW